MSLTQAALHSFKWSILAEIASKAIGPIVFIVLARLLVPEDFGVVAAATVLVSFFQIFWDAGLSKALVQKQDRVSESANVVFWVNIGLSAAVLVSLLWAADFIAYFFQDPRVGKVVTVLSILAPVGALGSVHTALLQKELHFKKLFWIRLTTTSVPALASIPLALSGAGYWALVAGTLTGQAAQTTALWLISTWRPRLSFDRSLAAELSRFGRWAMASALLAWCYGWMDAIFVGHYLGPHDMGLYRTGNTFVTLVFGLIVTPMLPVLYSVFSREQHNLAKLRAVLLFVARGVAIVTLPLAFGLLLLRHPIANLIFGPEWDGVAAVIGFLALVHGISWIVGANGEVYRAIGKPHIETLVTLSMLTVYFIGYLATVQRGLDVFLPARLMLALAAIGLHVWVACRYLNTSAYTWLRASVVPAGVSCALWLLLEFTGAMQQPSPLKFLYITVAMSTYLLYLATLERRYMLQMASVFSRRTAP